MVVGDIPVGYTLNIENLGETDIVTVMWVNELFDPATGTALETIGNILVMIDPIQMNRFQKKITGSII